MAMAMVQLAVLSAFLTMAEGARSRNRRLEQNDEVDTLRSVMGGNMKTGGASSPAFDVFRGFDSGRVAFFTAASKAPVNQSREAREWLEYFNIKNATWIPVFGDNCSTTTYDPQYEQMVMDADAIFIDGGQTGRVSSCFLGSFWKGGIFGGEETPLLKALKSKAIVGGTSAGAMVMPEGSILVSAFSPESYHAMKHFDVGGRSGIGLLGPSGPSQVVDTHLSERGRQGRLVVLAAKTGAKWAFGVDEGTSYLWRPSGVYEVAGRRASGVAIYQIVKAESTNQIAKMHYLTNGDKIDINTGQVTYNTDKTVCTTGAVPSGSDLIFDPKWSWFQPPYQRISIQTSQAPVGTKVTNFHGKGGNEVQVDFTNQEDTVAMCGPSGKSFENLHVQQFAIAEHIPLFNITRERAKKRAKISYFFEEDEA